MIFITGYNPAEIERILSDTCKLNQLFLQVGLSEPHRVGQAETVRIELEGSVPLQIDGEPWEQHPAVITITHSSQVQQKQL